MKDIKDLEKKVEEVVEKCELTAEELKDVAGGLDFGSMKEKDPNAGKKIPLINAGTITESLNKVIDAEGTVDQRIKR